jgi:hypothetical protein
VHNVALVVQHDVAVVTVLRLHKHHSMAQHSRMGCLIANLVTFDLCCNCICTWLAIGAYRECLLHVSTFATTRVALPTGIEPG